MSDDIVKPPPSPEVPKILRKGPEVSYRKPARTLLETVNAMDDTPSPNGTPVPPPVNLPKPDDNASVPRGTEPTPVSHDGTGDAVSVDDILDGDQGGDSAAPPVEKTEEELQLEEQELEKTRNLSGALKRLKDLRAEMRVLKAEHGEMYSRVQEYESGIEVPEAQKNLLERIEQLEKYEKIHSYKTSKEFLETRIAPLNGAIGKAKSIAEQYKVDPRWIDKLVNIKDVKERNTQISKLFDSVTGLEVLKHITEAQTIKGKIDSESEDPLQGITRITQEASSIREQRKAEVSRKVSVSAKASWVSSLTELKASPDMARALFDTTDKEFHGKVVVPILRQAASEYSKVINQMLASGAEDIPQTTLNAIAKAFQLQYFSPYLVKRNAKLESGREEVIEKETVRRQLNNPSPNSYAPSRITRKPAPQGGKERTTWRSMLDKAAKEG